MRRSALAKPKSAKKKVLKNSIWPTEPMRANRDLVKLLLSDPDFKEDVREACARAGLPEIGAENRAERIKELFEKGWEMLESPEFNKEEYEINVQLREKHIDRKIHRKLMAAHYDKISWMSAKHSAEFLCYKYNLPAHFELHIEWYLYGNGNNMGYPAENFSIGYDRAGGVSHKESKRVIVNVYAHLTIAEMGRLKKRLDAYCKILPEHRAIKDIDKMLEYEEWYDSRRDEYYEPGKDAYERVHLTDIVEDKLGSKKRVMEVHNAVRGLRRLREIRLKRRPAD